MKNFTRSDRVATRIKKELAELLIKDMRDPRLTMLTITKVTVSRDIKFAKVYYSFIGNEAKRKHVTEAISSAKGFMKKELASRLNLRYMPEMTFVYDNTLDYADRIDQILGALSQESEKSEITLSDVRSSE